jgi:hypothetical protein
MYTFKLGIYFHLMYNIITLLFTYHIQFYFITIIPIHTITLYTNDSQSVFRVT